jgi:hypothetical protein
MCRHVNALESASSDGVCAKSEPQLPAHRPKRRWKKPAFDFEALISDWVWRPLHQFEAGTLRRT